MTFQSQKLNVSNSESYKNEFFLCDFIVHFLPSVQNVISQVLNGIGIYLVGWKKPEANFPILEKTQTKKKTMQEVIKFYRYEITR